MSSQKSINKQKKINRKKKQQQLNSSWKIVNEANNIKDPLDRFNVFKKFTSNDLDLNISCYWVSDLDKGTLSEVFSLIKSNMKTSYENCDWGWNDEKKYEEMTEDKARYLIVKDKEDHLMGFSHFRFDIECDDEVLYLYELQLAPQVRRRGLGKFLLQALELIAFYNSMKKVVLTVLKSNHGAQKFFESMNYTVDEISPEETLFDSYSYIILSKKNKKLLTS